MWCDSPSWRSKQTGCQSLIPHPEPSLLHTDDRVEAPERTHAKGQSHMVITSRHTKTLLTSPKCTLTYHMWCADCCLVTCTKYRQDLMKTQSEKRANLPDCHRVETWIMMHVLFGHCAIHTGYCSAFYVDSIINKMTSQECVTYL